MALLCRQQQICNDLNLIKWLIIFLIFELMMEFQKPQRLPNKTINREQLKKVIQGLKRRRQDHDQRIKKLLSYNSTSQDTNKQSNSEGQFSEVLRRLEDEDFNQVQQSVEGLSSHVNLLATVSLKTQYHLVEKLQYKEPGRLYQSLIKAYPNKIFNFNFTGRMSSHEANWINQIVNYLIEWDLGQGLFTESGHKGKQIDYYGTRFKLGRYEEVQLSEKQLQKDEYELIFIDSNQKDTINISCLLLKRLVDLPNNSQMPSVLQRLFFFPFHSYAIRDSLQLIQFLEALAQLQQSFIENEQNTIKVYFQQTPVSSVECNIITPKENNLKAFTSLLHRYTRAIIVNEAELPVKQLPLSCLKNHFVVITLIIHNQGKYFISVGSDSKNQQFRICILSRQRHFIRSNIIKNGEFMYCTLNAQEYEVYISPIAIEVQQKNIEQSFELVHENQQSFCMWIQGRQVFHKRGDLNMEIRLKEEYNSFTRQIANSFIKLHNKKQEQQIQCEEGCLIVKRQILKVIGLVLDTFITANNFKVMVKYQRNSLCDQYFQKTDIIVVNSQSVVLYGPSQIESASYMNENNKVALKINFFTYYI